MKLSLRAIYAIILSVVLLLALGALLAYEYQVQTKQAEAALLEEARTFSREMDAVWQFMDNSQTIINYTADGDFEFKGLHCAIVGKSVGALFSRGSDYLIRYTNFEPRNIQGRPDDFEAAALNAFYDKAETEYYGVVDYRDKKSFRYVKALEVDESCLECHGEPVGELDITGKPKEGWQLGGVGGAISIVIPYEHQEQAIGENVRNDMVFMVGLMLLIGALVFLLTTRFVIRPLNAMQKAFDDTGEGRIGTEVDSQRTASKELATLAERFNQMSRELSDIYGNLEKQVAERTSELQDANEELARQRNSLQLLSDELAKEVNFKSDLLSMVNHELRTPLTSIISLAHLALEEEGISEGSARSWTEISNSGKTLLEMINNMLDIARSDAGEMRASIEPMDLGDVAAAVRATIGPLAQRYRVDFGTHVAPEVPLVQGDYEKTQRMLENLCSNAIKFTPDDGSAFLQIDLEQPSGDVVMTVRDTGIGIAPEDQQRVFDRFVQVDSTSTRKYNGSGLGLAIVKEYARLQGYQVQVESALGKGSTFIVRIPASCVLVE